PHAAQHVEVFRTVSGAEQIPVGVADAGDDGLVVIELGHQTLDQGSAVQPCGRGCRHIPLPEGFSLALPAGLPAVSSGDRMNATDACVMNACLMERSTMNAMSASPVSVWWAMPSVSNTGRMVRATRCWPTFGSPMVP